MSVIHDVIRGSNRDIFVQSLLGDRRPELSIADFGIAHMNGNSEIHRILVES